MGQVFHPATNAFARFSIFGVAFLVAGAFWLGGAAWRSPWLTHASVVRDQPVPFTHKLHAGQLGIDCRYCHTTVESSAFAGMPPTKTCMNCHAQIWTDSPMLEPVRASFRDDRRIPWVRVHRLGDFCYFDHSIHVAKGVACVTCHGRVDQMPLMWKEKTLFMEWCLECHREPERFVVPREDVFKPDAKPDLERGRRLVKEYGIQSMTSCSTCHR
jgi:Cytochrome c7 and related cytochrome c/Class III cytochrome C family